MKFGLIDLKEKKRLIYYFVKEMFYKIICLKSLTKLETFNAFTCLFMSTNFTKKYNFLYMRNILFSEGFIFVSAILVEKR